ncbi:MAG TPA: hypothetical protein PKI19_04070 [Elusimicrobiales bacterium]|nr:hypothetical protein [Elusimicrobiales bacterium]
MAVELMTKCEQKKIRLLNNIKTETWEIVEASSLGNGISRGIRCLHCHGRVRVHTQIGALGVPDHVEHKSRRDSENCQGGPDFKGVHRMSEQPVA